MTSRPHVPGPPPAQGRVSPSRTEAPARRVTRSPHVSGKEGARWALLQPEALVLQPCEGLRERGLPGPGRGPSPTLVRDRAVQLPQGHPPPSSGRKGTLPFALDRTPGGAPSGPPGTAGRGALVLQAEPGGQSGLGPPTVLPALWPEWLISIPLCHGLPGSFWMTAPHGGGLPAPVVLCWPGWLVSRCHHDGNVPGRPAGPGGEPGAVLDAPAAWHHGQMSQQTATRGGR